MLLAMLNDILLVCLATGLWFALGYPVARILGPNILSPATAAPPLGLAINAVLTLVFYIFGFRLTTAFQLSILLTIPGIGLILHDRLLDGVTHNNFIVWGASLSTTTVIILLPKWLGHPDFSVFQANIGDQFWYLSTSFMAMHHDFATIRDNDISSLVAIGSGVATPYDLMLRPSVALLLGGFASILYRPAPLVSYAYLGALQLCVFFASVFVSRNVFKLPMQSALWVSIALTVGFFVQYVFDTNAWSHLASVPLTVVCVGLFLLGLLRTPLDRTNDDTNIISTSGFFWSMLVCMTGFMYIYPETLPMIASLTAPIAIWQLFNSLHRTYVFRRLVLFSVAAVFAVILCAPAWPMTVGIFLTEFDTVANTTAYSPREDWWKFSHSYLFGYDNDPNRSLISEFQNHSVMRFLCYLLSISTSFLAGIFGVYFLLPPTYVYLPGAIASLAILACLVVLTLRRFSVVNGEVGEQHFDSNYMLLVPVVGGLLLAICIFSTVPLPRASFKDTYMSLLIPQENMLSLGFFPRTVWKLGLAACLTYLVIHWIRDLAYPSSGVVDQRIDEVNPIGRTISVGTSASLAGGILLVIFLLAIGRYWAAGKGLIMLSPMLFLAFTGSLLASIRRRRIMATVLLVYIGTQIGFGVYRSYAASQGVLAFPLYPYPVDMYRKPMYRWDYAGLQKELKGCFRVDVHVEDDVYAEMFVEMILIHSGIRWSSRRFVRDGRDYYGFGGGIQKQIENPDCIVSTDVRDITDTQTTNVVIWLRREPAMAK